MSISHSLTRVVVATAAVFSLLLAATPARAAVIGSFDPAFGLDIPNLGFRGTFSLDVAPGCYTRQAQYVFTGGACEITVNTISIFFYNSTLNPTGDPSGTLSQITLDSGFFVNGDDTQATVDYVSGAYFNASNQLVAFDTEDSYQFPVTVTDNSAGASISYNGDMLLYFVSGYQPPVQIDPAFLVNCNTAAQEESTCSRETGTVSNPATVTIGAVSEPETISLALLGLVAMVAGNRRARRLNGTRSHTMLIQSS